MTARILIVEDDPQLNRMLSFHFEDEGFRVTGVLTCAAARQRLDETDFDLVLLDQQLPDGTGIDLLNGIQRQQHGPVVVMMTGQHDLELAIDAIKKGAADFIHKPVKSDELRKVVQRVLENRRLSQEMASRGAPPAPLTPPRELIGRSEAMLAVSKEIALSAESNASVLITGESGTGKEVVARLIHIHSGRKGPFVALNCAAIVDTLLESELFGHEKGAFTGAVSRKPGKFELAENGTLFLDEIGELALPLQAKLLRALQERVFEPVGGTHEIHTNARIIAATNRSLLAEAANGRFRDDLIYRLNVISIHLPTLRERPEDIPLLVDALLDKIASQLQKAPPQVTDPALRKLQSYDWPGNVRELENILTQAVVHARDPVLTPDLLTIPASDSQRQPAAHVQSAVAAAPAGSVPRTLEQVEAQHIQEVLNFTGGHKGRTSEILHISRPALDRKIKKYQLRVPSQAG